MDQGVQIEEENVVELFAVSNAVFIYLSLYVQMVILFHVSVCVCLRAS